VGAPTGPVRHPFIRVPHMNTPWLAAGSALFVWWFSTGLILWRVRHADNMGRNAHLTSVIATLPLLILGLYGVHTTLDDATPQGAYLAFLAALAIWGWIELAFLSGIITGPNTDDCPPNTPFPERFIRAFGTIAWHEALLALTTVGLVLWTRAEPNTFALWTFVILFFARVSAKLNLFFGVPRIHTEFLPKPLTHLSSHFRNAPMNGVFPISITALSFAAACWMERAVTATTDAHLIGFTLLSALTLLALLEHWFMVLPLPDQKLWRWMLPAHKLPMIEKKEQTHGL
jgi:putative photosynthetic complex assembly protein 2